MQEWAREYEPMTARYQVRTLRPTAKVNSERRAFEILAAEQPRRQGVAEAKLVWKKTPRGQGAKENRARRLLFCLSSLQVWSQ
jgi:anti-sigma-K factor RskA